MQPLCRGHEAQLVPFPLRSSCMTATGAGIAASTLDHTAYGFIHLGVPVSSSYRQCCIM